MGEETQAESLQPSNSLYVTVLGAVVTQIHWGIVEGKSLLEDTAASWCQLIPADATAETLHSAGAGPSGHHILQPLLEQTRAREGKNGVKDQKAMIGMFLRTRLFNPAFIESCFSLF